jgi:shikimate dehydrogenase
VTPRRFALIGHPVAHSISPEIHRAAYAAFGQPHEYEAVDCPDEASVERRVAELRAGALEGLNVTVPWKLVALGLADRRDPLAEQIGAANVLARAADGAVVAYNTDVLALIDELTALAPGARAAAVIGSGGAALAAVAGCKKLGMREIAVTARRFTDDGLAAPEAEKLRSLGATTLIWPAEGGAAQAAWARAVTNAGVILQATSAGMQGAAPGESVRDLVDWRAADPKVFVYDVVYNPAVTPFVAAARAAGLRAESGLGMLVGQAARAIEIWLGEKPPRAVLESAAEQALGKRRQR